MTVESQGWPNCEVCGVSALARTVTVTSSSTLSSAVCSLCQGLIDSGLLRAEAVDGVRRYRQWFPEWKPGALLPLPAARAA